jgi:hypothetical protein
VNPENITLDQRIQSNTIEKSSLMAFSRYRNRHFTFFVTKILRSSNVNHGSISSSIGVDARVCGNRHIKITLQHSVVSRWIRYLWENVYSDLTSSHDIRLWEQSLQKKREFQSSCFSGIKLHGLFHRMSNVSQGLSVSRIDWDIYRRHINKRVSCNVEGTDF